MKSSSAQDENDSRGGNEKNEMKSGTAQNDNDSRNGHEKQAVWMQL
jgi:hypothetical protein